MERHRKLESNGSFEALIIAPRPPWPPCPPRPCATAPLDRQKKRREAATATGVRTRKFIEEPSAVEDWFMYGMALPRVKV
jgi:hypothetical protein